MSKFTVETYSARQLSPFTGNVQIVKTPFARALSLDGSSWQIQTICESHQQQWNINTDSQRRFIIYGSWHIDNQLSRLPIDPSLDVPEECIIQKYLINEIKNHLRNLPFKQQDVYECWLLHNETDLPVVLLATCTDSNLISTLPYIKRWRSRSGTETQFTSIPTSYPDNPFIMLESKINDLASAPSGAHWFLRNDDRSGRELHGPKERLLEAADFPELLLNTNWADASLSQLTTDYTHWLAPRLLTLQHISSKTRSMLETAAQSQPIEVFRYHKNYPAIINQELINKILVEAKLRISSIS